MFSVPLLEPSAIVVHRLDPHGTWAVDPDGAGPIQQGYDSVLNEPYIYEDAQGDKAVATRYLAPIRIPCQVEVADFEEVRQVVSGDAPITQMVFVLHNSDLRRLDLMRGNPTCPRSGGVKLKTNDLINAIEVNGRPGIVSTPLKEPLYIVEIQPGSWGMGITGQDLHIVYTATRPSTPT